MPWRSTKLMRLRRVAFREDSVTPHACGPSWRRAARDGAWYSGRINASYRAASGSANPAMLVTWVNSTKTNRCRIYYQARTRSCSPCCLSRCCAAGRTRARSGARSWKSERLQESRRDRYLPSPPGAALGEVLREGTQRGRRPVMRIERCVRFPPSPRRWVKADVPATAPQSRGWYAGSASLQCRSHSSGVRHEEKMRPGRDHDVAFAMIATREITKRHSSDDVAPAGTARWARTFAF
jgi:hypothetical protein